MRRLLIAMLLGLTATPTDARWLRADTVHFRVYSDGSEPRLRTTASELESYWQLLEMMTGTSATAAGAKLDIYLVDGPGELRAIKPDMMKETRGFYIPSTAALSVFSVAQGIGFDRQILQHEVAHHFMFATHRSTYPAWYVEGFAEYAMTAKIAPGRIEIGDANPGRANILLYGGWLPVAKLMTATTSDLRGDQVGQFYAEAWLATHYLSRTPARQPALMRYLRAVSEGRGDQASFTDAFGTDYAGLDKELRAYIHSNHVTKSVIVGGKVAKEAQVTVMAMPPSADRLMLSWADLRTGVLRGDAGAARLAQVRHDAAAFPSDPFALTVLGDAETMFGDRAAGRHALDAVLAAEPNNVEALHLRGLNDMLTGIGDSTTRPAAFASARRYFGRAFRIDPNHYPTLYRYAMLSEGFGQGNENSLNALLLAADLAPETPDIAVSAALALMRRGRFDEAVAQLKPVANNPHGAPDGVKRLLAAAQAHTPLQPGVNPLADSTSPAK